ncbi:MAG: hypothetical protein AABW79_00955 [Nanoarchaeota archaeon]
MERGFVLLFSLIVAFSFLQSVFAEDAFSGEVPFANETKFIQDFAEQDQGAFLREQWKTFFLENSAIANVDSFLQSISSLFLVILAVDYSFSLNFFFILILWIMTLFIAFNYLVLFKEKPYLRWVFALGSVVILAQIRLFSLVSSLLSKLLFYRVEWWWSLLSWLVVFIVLAVYYIVNKKLARVLQATRAEKEKAEMKQDVKKVKILTDSIKSAG